MLEYILFVIFCAVFFVVIFFALFYLEDIAIRDTARIVKLESELAHLSRKVEGLAHSLESTEINGDILFGLDVFSDRLAKRLTTQENKLGKLNKEFKDHTLNDNTSIYQRLADVEVALIQIRRELNDSRRP